MQTPRSSPRKVVAVVGGGLVGALSSCFMAERGHEVHLYEYREDIRTLDHVPGRSINLTLSKRGLSALNQIGLGNHITQEYGILVRGRMIHTMDGRTYPIMYGRDDDEETCTYSVSRRTVNEILLTAAERYPNLHVHFEHKLIGVDVKETTMTFQDNSNEFSASADVILGCDGAYSSIRTALMKTPLFNYSQEYITHNYIELCIPAVKGEKNGNDDFAMSPNFIHIWPHGSFMLTALPNRDKSFSACLFMPREDFCDIRSKSRDDIVSFFAAHFPDVMQMIGTDKLVDDFMALEPSPMVSIKCSPYHYKDKALLLGDAAHAMVPFYGQGMNCGMEDVLVLDQLMDENPGDLAAAFSRYTSLRARDAHAMCDLAQSNYIELRDSVTRPSYHMRKQLDSFLHWMLPKHWVPLYTAVTFTRTRYHKCLEDRKWQDRMILRFSTFVPCFAAVAAAAGCMIAGHF